MYLQSGKIFAMLVAAVLLFSGCGGDKKESGTKENGEKKSNVTTTQPADHSGWWCVEHAIPEEECSMCSADAAKKCKEAGDWCKEHNRAESQCFICNPGNAEKYAKLYEAKFGKKPPAPTE